MLTDIWRSTSKLASGTGLGYLVLLILSPVITRLYTPEVFGVFAVFNAIVAIGSVFMSQSLELGMLSAKRMGQSFQIAKLAIVLATFVSVLAISILMIINVLYPSVSVKNLPLWIVVLGIMTCWIATATSVGLNWAIRLNRPGLAARATFVNLSGRSVLQSILGLFMGGIGGLVIGEILGRLAGWLTIERGITKRAFELSKPKLAALGQTYKDNRDYPLLVTPAHAMDSALFWLPAPLFTFAFGLEAGGLIAIVQRLGAIPLTLANQSIAQLFHINVTKLIRTNPEVLVSFMYRFILIVCTAALPVATVLALYGESIVAVVLGSLWAQAGVVALVMLPMYVAQVINLLSLRVILVDERFKLRFGIAAMNTILMISPVALGRLLQMSWLETLALQSGLLMLSFAGTTVYAIYKLKHEERKLLSAA